jgi:hypothetical protein
MVKVGGGCDLEIGTDGEGQLRELGCWSFYTLGP